MVDFFWLLFIVYCIEIRGIFKKKGILESWQTSVGQLTKLFFGVVIGPTLLFRLFLLPYVLFIFPDIFFPASFYQNISRTEYVRLILGISLYLGYASVLTYLLGWISPITKEDTEAKHINILSRSFSVISLFSLILIVFSSINPSYVWRHSAPKHFSEEDIVAIFAGFGRHLLVLGAIGVGIGLLTLGKLLHLVSGEKNQLPLLSLGLILSGVVGLICGYLLGAALPVLVLEIPFIVGSMTGIGFLLLIIGEEISNGTLIQKDTLIPQIRNF